MGQFWRLMHRPPAHVFIPWANGRCCTGHPEGNEKVKPPLQVVQEGRLANSWTAVRWHVMHILRCCRGHALSLSKVRLAGKISECFLEKGGDVRGKS